MKLSQNAIEQLRNVINLASLCQLDRLIISGGKIRGHTEDNVCIVLSQNNVPEFDLPIGFTRIKELKTRMLALAELSIKTVESSRGEIQSLELSSGKNRVQYRCVSPKMIESKIPSNVPDSLTPANVITLTREDVGLLSDAYRIMGGKLITLEISDTVVFRIKDATNDVWATELSNEIASPADMTVNYPAAVLLPLIKESLNERETVALNIGHQHTLNIVLRGHKVIVMPQIDTDEE